MDWKSIGVAHWVRYIHIEIIDSGTLPNECDSVDNNKPNEKTNLPQGSNDGKY